ncbi:Conserved_hypothetical protein [Hexamita inflata]|uniref:Uncharacterized protein n=1 Tax=Hexamita inflata TaxID=28002 RepID=A0AA86V2N4_9EUKA|nr:Conserved hypothetical protein [Hexamita inflata]
MGNKNFINVILFDQIIVAGKQQHNVFQGVKKVQNIQISSEIAHNTNGDISSYQTFSQTKLSSMSQVIMKINLTSRYISVSFIMLFQLQFNITQSQFNFTCVDSHSVSTFGKIVDLLEFQQVIMYFNVSGQYVSGLVMISFSSTRIVLNSINIYGTLNGNIMTTQITAFQGESQIEIEGTICLSMSQNNCVSCFLISMTTCCPHDATIISNSNFYSCMCTDQTRTLLDPLNYNTTTCVCKENYFISNLVCVQCPLNATSNVNSDICICLMRYQSHIVSNNSCSCTPSYSFKAVDGTCTCVNGAEINSSTCYCMKNFTLASYLGSYSCVCAVGNFIKDYTCIKCPDDAYTQTNNSAYCICSQQYQTHNMSSNECECTPTYSTKLYGVCSCPSGADISEQTQQCTCRTANYTLQANGCSCPINRYIYNKICLPCPTGSYSSTINSTTCVCSKANSSFNASISLCYCTIASDSFGGCIGSGSND